ncbi:N-formylglutamate deformylase [Marinomonas transparens]|uniref:N-formylglutamate deformylase n=1 Tax=Marinomonas transparens TaxID=2795388 RepID=A0A934JM24_9GAMM|nr:N-formylglutamate deformylase [Marinomonas transparens]MBJ7538680.1 N-formylglutamate deformylase [Marinomonas transparens]
MNQVERQSLCSNIDDPFDFLKGDTPLLISMPHSGVNVPSEIVAGLTEQAQKLPDTDWFIPELYGDLASLGVSCIKANYSRYVIDLNRPVDDKPLYTTKTTGLFPDILFDESPVFKESVAPSAAQRSYYKSAIWQPYHSAIATELARLKAKFGYAILLDAHSIAAQVPMLFEGTLPDFNWGTNQGQSCSVALLESAQNCLSSQYSQVANGRFKGGYITRHFGQPRSGIHAIQLELSQATYLNDELAKQSTYQLDDSTLPVIQQQLQALVEALLNTKL